MKTKGKFHYTKQEILDGARIGLEIEFYSMLKSTQIIRLLTKELGVKVVLPLDVDTFNKKKPKYHSALEPTANLFKLEIDNSGGSKMKELITGPMSYGDARKVIIKVLKWIKVNGWTSDKTSIHLNVSFDDWKIYQPIPISHINKLKLVLDTNEDFIYRRFPSRKGNIYARSVKDVFVNNIFYYIKNSKSLSITQFKVPTEKYYGINFKKINDDYAEFRYIGGAKYETKIPEIFECLDYFILLLYENIIDTKLSSSQLKKLKNFTTEHKKVLDGYKDPKVFQMNFPEIQVMSDMQIHEEILKSQWHNFKDKLFELIVLGKLRKGEFNYDSDMNSFQLKNGVIDGIELKGFELLECTISGFLEDCDLHGCEIKNAIIKRSIFNSDNKAFDSKIEECMLFSNNKLKDCYVDNKENVINCEVIGGIIRSGVKGKNSKISKDTEIVELKDN